MNNIPQLTPSEFAEFSTRATKLYKIRSEQNKLIGYNFNEAQEILERVRKEEFARSQALRGKNICRMIILKGRQVGATTDTAMFNLDTMLNLNMARGLILAHDDKSTPVIYHKYRLAYNNLPDIIQFVDEDGTPLIRDGEPVYYAIKPDTESYSGFNLKFVDGGEHDNLNNGSNLYVRTAGSGDNVGKGDTLNFAHFSEAANYNKYKQVVNSANQQMAEADFVYSIIESTANGISGDGEGFYQAWTTAIKEWKDFEAGRTKSFDGYRPVFVPWYEMSKYREPLIGGKLNDISNVNWHSPEYKKEYLDLEEQIIEEIFDEKEEGLRAANWYRKCIKFNCEYDYIDAKRYYPTRPEDAFIASDKGFFDSGKLFAVKTNYEKTGPRRFEKGYVKDDEFIEESNGELKIWKHPVEGWYNRYVISIDPSYGIEGGDYSCIMVFDRKENEFVAKWYGNLKEDLVAEELLNIAYYYNEGLIIPEMNLKTVLSLIEPDGLMPYTGPIYERFVKSRNTVDYGYNTLSHNKKDLLMNYNAWLRDNYDKLPDIEVVDEHITFIKKITQGLPKYEASEGNHDDQVVACALAIEGHNWWDEEIYSVDEIHDKIDKMANNKKKMRVLRGSQLRSTGKKSRGTVRLSNL